MSSLTPITVARLKACGFIDPANNGCAYRKDLPGGVFEIVWYCKVENFLRLQTTMSGGAIPLKGVDCMESLNTIWYFLSKEQLQITK